MLFGFTMFPFDESPSEAEVTSDTGSADWQYIGDSECINAVKYDIKTNTLSIRFQDNSVYEYSDFPHLQFYNFIRSTSRGYFFNRAIRNNYEYSRIA